MIIHDTNVFKYKVLEGKKAKPGVLMSVEGVFQRADTKNANGRVYPTEVWTDVLKREDTKTRLEKRQMVGMLGHPSSGQTDPEKVSHVVTKQELRSDGTVHGEADILDTPHGRIAATMFEAGVTLGISSRGDGSVKKKGGTDEVQKDFGLETYDFVFKPSTPGAFPGVVEGISENESKLVVEAIEGLVKSELPEEQRVTVLAECLKILQAVDEANPVDPVRSLLSKLQEEVGIKEPKVLLRLEAEENIEDQPSDKEIEMHTNGNGQDQPKGLDQATFQWHQEQIKSAVEAAVAQKDSEVAEVKDVLVKAQKEHSETRKRLSAAEGIIEDFQKKFKKMQESDDKSPAYLALKERYDAGVELLDAAIPRLKELGESRSRVESLEKLLQASIDKFKGEKMEAAMSEALAKLPSDVHEKAKPMLEACDTPEKIHTTVEGLLAVSGRPAVQSTEPLPGTTINEDVVAAPAPVAKNFHSILSSRLANAV